MMDKQMSAAYGVKFNPFSPEIPVEGLLARAEVGHFCRRVENLAREGGFALLTGAPGLGKSAALRLLVQHLDSVRDLKVGVLTRPQCKHADFYREMGDIFGVNLSPHNRYGGTQLLRERWRAHVESSLVRPVLIVDEAQEMLPSVLGELRLMMSTQLDSRALLAVVLCGDERLVEKFRKDDLVAIGSRIRVRLVLDAAPPAQLLLHLRHVLEKAGNPRLLSAGVQTTLCEHAAGNLRVLMNMAAELLDAAAARDVTQIDEKLYLEVFSPPSPAGPVRRAAGGKP